jgi:hypothetical protein
MNASPPAPCRAILTPAGEGSFGLQFELANPAPQASSLRTYRPFLQFQVRAAAGSTELAVVQPVLDLPVEPMTVTVPAGGTTVLATPVRLRFRAGAPPSDDRFLWSIAHEPRGVRLTFTLQLPPPYDQPFTADL